MSEVITSQDATAIAVELFNYLRSGAEPQVVKAYLTIEAERLGLEPVAFTIGVTIGIEALIVSTTKVG